MDRKPHGKPIAPRRRYRRLNEALMMKPEQPRERIQVVTKRLKRRP